MASTTNGVPYPVGTDKVMDGDNAIQALAQYVDDMSNTRCRVYRAGSPLSLTTSTWTPVPLDTEQIDTKNMWLIADPTKFVIKRTGRYLVIGTVQFVSPGATATGARLVGLARNGSIQQYTGHAPIANNPSTVQYVATHQFNLNDYVELYAQQGQGVALNVANSSTTVFDVSLVGIQ